MLNKFIQKAKFSSIVVPKYAPWSESKILVTGCQGQLGVPLVHALCQELGPDQVLASDI